MHTRWLACILFACTAHGCTSAPDEDAAIDLELAPEPGINSVEDILRRMHSLKVVVDSPGGLYPPGAAHLEGNVRIEDDDGDPSDLELVAFVPISKDRLPSIRLSRGSLPNVELSVRVRGYLDVGAKGTPIALGSATNLRFRAGEAAPISVPFNLLPEMLPPRVTEVYPKDGELAQTCALREIAVVFSKAIDPTSIDQHVSMTQRNGPITIVPVVHGHVVYLRTETNPVGEYTLHVSSDVTDLGGAHLDQTTELAGDQPFERTFRVECDEQSEGLSCGNEDYGWCSGETLRFSCVGARCVPARCDGVTCSAGYVCDPASAMCEVDCRIYGDSSACPPERPTCDSTGACITDEEEPTLGLLLVPDSRINATEDILQVVRSVLVVVDSPDGLFPPGAEHIEGNVVIMDIDGDPSDLEVVAISSMTDQELPAIRVRRGLLPDASLFVRAFGMSEYVGGGSILARGAAMDLHITKDAPASISVPFNLLPQLLPPRVMDVSPTDGERVRSCAPAAIDIVFSKAIARASDGNFWIQSEGGARQELFPSLEGNVAHVELETYPVGPYTLYVSADVTDLQGRRLDQVAGFAGNQPFEQTFDVECDTSATLPSCDSDPEGWCPGPEGRFECMLGTCVPSSCSSLTCTDGYVCDPATAFCDIDCRIYGDSSACPLNRPVCDDTTGTCMGEPG